jgi:D-sedoheptulose 7-phosphate isomerase
MAQPALGRQIGRLADAIEQVIVNGGRLFLFGNGGSAAAAQHAAAEWIGRFESERRALPAIALTTDSSVLTAVGNDYGFDRVFERQLDGLAGPNDLAIGLSTSGNSSNVLRGLQTAKRKGALTAAFLGRGGGRARKMVDLAIVVPASRVSLIQEAHDAVLHVLCEEVDRRLRK